MINNLGNPMEMLAQAKKLLEGVPESEQKKIVSRYQQVIQQEVNRVFELLNSNQPIDTSGLEKLSDQLQKELKKWQ